MIISKQKQDIHLYAGADYHWYRQDSDGIWSHKRGQCPVERTVYSGNLIIDPMLADRGSYTRFLGYYAASPWNGIFENTK